QRKAHVKRGPRRFERLSLRSDRLPSGHWPTEIRRSVTRPSATFSRFVHADSTTVEFLTVELDHRVLRGLLVRHRDETEATRAAGFAIFDHDSLDDIACLLEESLECLVGRVPTQPTHEELGRRPGALVLASVGTRCSELAFF